MQRGYDDDDLHLALYLCFEVGYHGFAGVERDWANEPTLLTVRDRLGERFLAAVARHLSARSRPGRTCRVALRA